jgi:hypothetical protein
VNRRTFVHLGTAGLASPALAQRASDPSDTKPRVGLNGSGW